MELETSTEMLCYTCSKTAFYAKILGSEQNFMYNQKRLCRMAILVSLECLKSVIQISAQISSYLQKVSYCLPICYLDLGRFIFTKPVLCDYNAQYWSFFDTGNKLTMSLDKNYVFQTFN